MNHVLASLSVAALAWMPSHRLVASDVAVELPAGVRAVWTLDTAQRDATPTRERVSLNGLWRWQPAGPSDNAVPTRGWGYFKIPGCWPGVTDYLRKDSQTLYAHPDWKDTKPGTVRAAWHEREFDVPADWTGRRVVLSADNLNSFATVFVDGGKAGELHFPADELDLTASCPPGTKHRLDVLVVALPLKATLLSYTDSASARQLEGSVERRGFCGDVSLVGIPAGPRIGGIAVDTSVRDHRLSLDVAIGNLQPDANYILRAEVRGHGNEPHAFASPAFRGSSVTNGHVAFSTDWMPAVLWDIHTPGNQLDLTVTFEHAGGGTLDVAWPLRFGFREFRIEGRDFILNGKRLHLSAVPLDNAQIGAAQSTYEAARETLLRLRGFGINYVYTHHYGCEPGAHLGFGEILRAADDVGMLVGFTQPHFSHYDWKAPDADEKNGYARHASSYVRMAGNHPSVVMYVTSHNATGYEEDMNPDLTDGIHEGRDEWADRNVKLALRAEAIVKRFDPRRILYHHASGNLGVMHDSNFYPNFAPIQELDDWFGHWAAVGTKPVFTCEYGAPFTWDWTLYRGWYKGQREWGGAKVPWEFCVAEWNAQFLGDHAYAISDAEKANLRWEAKQYRAGNTWHRWDYPNPVGSDRFEERYPIFARYITSNWRAYRTLGVSGTSPWEYEHFWKARPGVDRGRKALTVDWDHLQRPGFSPDYIDRPYERMDMAFGRDDWIATPAARALIRNNSPLLAYIAGKTNAITSKDHDFRRGETVGKTLVVINDGRETTACDVTWTTDPPGIAAGAQRVEIAPGDQARIPIRVELPAAWANGAIELRMTAAFDSGEIQRDQFAINVVPDRDSVPFHRARVALFDPKGETRRLLETLRFDADTIDAATDLAGYDLLVVGKGALSVDGPAPSMERVREGLRVVVFEQTSEALQKRLGFRVEEYGLREVFARVPDHPALAGITAANLADWRGDATLLPPRLPYEMRPRYGPTVEWAGLKSTRVWRCGNRGNVASVLVETPARGDFLPIVVGGFGLQYSPLLEYREDRGMVVFCQLDVTGRSEPDPAAENLAANLLRHALGWKPMEHHRVAYAGDPAGLAFLKTIGIDARSTENGWSKNDILVAGPGSGKALAKDTKAVQRHLDGGGGVLGIGWEAEDAAMLLPGRLELKRAEHISAYFEPAPRGSLLAGIGPADLHNRDPREFPLPVSGMRPVGDGVLSTLGGARFVLAQLPPWQFGGTPQPNLKRSYRRSSGAVSRLLGNLGAAGTTPLLGRLGGSMGANPAEKRWADGFYVDSADEWDDPYRFFRW